jgi:hypothetical protein
MNKLIFCLLIYISFSAHSRSPQGEYSALVENNKKRSDFKSEKEMMQYIKKHDKKFMQKLRNKRKKQ